MPTTNNHNIAFIGVKKQTEDGKVAFNIRGSGIILEGKKFITCAHVFNEISADLKNFIFCGICEKTESIIKNYNFLDLKFVDKDDKRDVALFDIIDPANKLAEYGFSETDLANESAINGLEAESDIFFAGFPLANEFLKMNMGITLMASKCIIGSLKYNTIDKKIDFILIDKAVNPGSSGSPVFHDNKIIGLASGTINQGHKIGETLVNVPVGVGMVKTSNYILDLLSKNKR